MDQNNFLKISIVSLFIFLLIGQNAFANDLQWYVQCAVEKEYSMVREIDNEIRQIEDNNQLMLAFPRLSLDIVDKRFSLYWSMDKILSEVCVKRYYRALELENKNLEKIEQRNQIIIGLLDTMNIYISNQNKYKEVIEYKDSGQKLENIEIDYINLKIRELERKLQQLNFEICHLIGKSESVLINLEYFRFNDYSLVSLDIPSLKNLYDLNSFDVKYYDLERQKNEIESLERIIPKITLNMYSGSNEDRFGVTMSHFVDFTWVNANISMQFKAERVNMIFDVTPVVNTMGRKFEVLDRNIFTDTEFIKVLDIFTAMVNQYEKVQFDKNYFIRKTESVSVFDWLTTLDQKYNIVHNENVLTSYQLKLLSMLGCDLYAEIFKKE